MAPWLADTSRHIARALLRELRPNWSSSRSERTSGSSRSCSRLGPSGVSRSNQTSATGNDLAANLLLQLARERRVVAAGLRDREEVSDSSRIEDGVRGGLATTHHASTQGLESHPVHRLDDSFSHGLAARPIS